MYGVPADLDLSHYLNATCVQIAMGEFQIQLHFQPVATIAIEGRWELREAAGDVVDQTVPNDSRDSYRLHLLLAQQVVDCNVVAPTSFSLTFNSGHTLEVFDDSNQYESCHLSPSGVII